mmetsp:Transcript_40308/g.97339  ORF Transcript_40308/g.97339 Transcript_40308/m.97339 type:complete len:520 (+) Transcript_40308:97-1656(+)|eukprot:CAMPEP_0113624418 /NCGR_PEP_ID=MMETSP0017_2-20120614/12583_1 /TAXON_ID=2856 /ORGANISM="Cylindrotheca closterium" /LENGTH=519 /DNA_ID=CAMNT_0000534439 /DNA_START=44 /DNA_END=1603 /DNA_ORIENTATION=+ /assembly_acc=CAM_ASM_000147
MASFPNHNLQKPSVVSCLQGGSPSPQNRPLNSPSSDFQLKELASPETKQTEDFLTSEFNQLSEEEQTKALNDLYCVGEELSENPNLIEKSLAEFEQQLRNGNFPIIQTALKQNRSYVEDASFRLKFLRANMYNVAKSVNQMVNFLGHKATYFGVDKIARDITLEDLTQEDIELMLSGFYHIQEGTDQGGRVIVYMFNHMLGKYKAETLIRVNYYIWFNILISLPAVQKKGLVAVYWDLRKPGEAMGLPGLHWMVSVLDYIQSVPVRYSASHICTKTGTGSDTLDNFVLGMALKAMPEYARVRARFHQGSDKELQDQLQRHGFPSTFPVDSDGNLRRGILNVWFHLHMANEASCAQTYNRVVVMEERPTASSSTSMADGDEEEDTVAIGTPEHPWGYVGNLIFSGSSNPTPARTNEDAQAHAQRISPDHTEKDVLLGRGRDIQNHVGNIRFREFLTAHQDQYDDAPRNQRRQIAANLYNVLKADGIRFWHKSPADEWEEIGALEGEKKIGQLFRTRRKRK